MGSAHGLLRVRFNLNIASYKLQAILATYFNGHGFLISDYDRDKTKLQEGPLCLNCSGLILALAHRSLTNNTYAECSTFIEPGKWEGVNHEEEEER